MDTRVGYPGEHWLETRKKPYQVPLFATSVGLLMSALEGAAVATAPSEKGEETPTSEDSEQPAPVAAKRKSILDRFGEKLKEFLDNA